MSALLLPDQEMANWANKEVAVAKSKDPPFAPYLVPKLTEQPWMPADSDHTAAKTKWAGYAKQARRPILPKELIAQSFSLYHLRLIFAVDLCQAFSKFGGVGPQLAHLSTARHIGITESVGEALSYHRIAGARLQEMARRRATLAADFVTGLASGNFTFKEQDKMDMALAIEADHEKQDTSRDPKAKGKGRKGDKNGQPFQPRRNAARFDTARNADHSDVNDPARDEAQQRQRPRTPQNNRRNNASYVPNLNQRPQNVRPRNFRRQKNQNRQQHQQQR